MQTDLTETETTVFIALYGQPPGESACCTKTKQSPKVKILASTSTMHVRWACLPVSVRKQQSIKPLMSQPISFSSAMRSGMAFRLLFLF